MTEFIDDIANRKPRQEVQQPAPASRRSTGYERLGGGFGFGSFRFGLAAALTLAALGLAAALVGCRLGAFGFGERGS